MGYFYSKVQYKSWAQGRRETGTQVRARERERPITNAKNKKPVTSLIRIPSKHPRPYPRTRTRERPRKKKQRIKKPTNISER
jgi:hypothetical protein